MSGISVLAKHLSSLGPCGPSICRQAILLCPPQAEKNLSNYSLQKYHGTSIIMIVCTAVSLHTTFPVHIGPNHMAYCTARIVGMREPLLSIPKCHTRADRARLVRGPLSCTLFVQSRSYGPTLRRRAIELLKIGIRLSQRLGADSALADVWVGHVMPSEGAPVPLAAVLSPKEST